jgi:uncharacterized protein DUF4230
MQGLKRGTVLLLVAALFGFGIFCGLKVSQFAGLRTAGPMYGTPVLLKQVQALSELVTVKYVLEKAEVWNDPPKPMLALFGAGDNHILLLAHGYVKAGVDLSQLRPGDLEVHEKTVILTLPPAKITDWYLDDKETKVIERTTGFLRSFDKDLEQNVRAAAVESMKNAALREGIRREADERARTQLKNLLLQLGYEKVEFRDRPSLSPG